MLDLLGFFAPCMGVFVLLFMGGFRKLLKEGHLDLLRYANPSKKLTLYAIHAWSFLYSRLWCTLSIIATSFLLEDLHETYPQKNFGNECFENRILILLEYLTVLLKCLSILLKSINLLIHIMTTQKKFLRISSPFLCSNTL